MATAEAASPARAVRRDDKIHCWPYLVRLEFLVAMFTMIVLIAWSIFIDAPLEEPANPARTPNPSKAPWYFLGLQEMLVYFDPWIAGVVLPSLIIVGLMAIPYIDINPKGSGYYTFRERKFEITVYTFGFIGLWVLMINLGTFLRGPGWNFFAPGEIWDPHKVVALTNVDLVDTGLFKWMNNPKIFGSELIGLVLVAGYFVLTLALPYFYLMKKRPHLMEVLGPTRYFTTAFLFWTMMALPIKMFLRIAFNVKYVWVTPWFNI